MVKPIGPPPPVPIEWIDVTTNNGPPAKLTRV